MSEPDADEQGSAEEVSAMNGGQDENQEENQQDLTMEEILELSLMKNCTRSKVSEVHDISGHIAFRRRERKASSIEQQEISSKPMHLMRRWSS